LSNETKETAKHASSDHKTSNSHFLRQNLTKIILQNEPLVSIEDVCGSKLNVKISIKDSLSELVDIGKFKESSENKKKSEKEVSDTNNQYIKTEHDENNNFVENQKQEVEVLSGFETMRVFFEKKFKEIIEPQFSLIHLEETLSFGQEKINLDQFLADLNEHVVKMTYSAGNTPMDYYKRMDEIGHVLNHFSSTKDFEFYSNILNGNLKPKEIAKMTLDMVESKNKSTCKENIDEAKCLSKVNDDGEAITDEDLPLSELAKIYQKR
jgi:hypothetical protein